MSFQSKQVTKLEVNIFPHLMKVVIFCTTSAIKHSTLNHFRKIEDIITQPTVVRLTSVLNIKTVLQPNQPIALWMNVDKDMFINMMVLLNRTLPKTFKVIWRPVVDTKSKQALRKFDGSPGKTWGPLQDYSTSISQTVHKADYSSGEVWC